MLSVLGLRDRKSEIKKDRRRFVILETLILHIHLAPGLERYSSSIPALLFCYLSFFSNTTKHIYTYKDSDTNS